MSCQTKVERIDELGIVVEHLLEMRNEPARIGRIAGEPAAEMIVDAALAHRIEGLHDRIAIGRLAGALPGPPQQFENPGLREFRRRADPTMQLIGLAQQTFGDFVEQLPADGAAPLRTAEPLQSLAQWDDVLRHLVAVSRIGVAHRLQDLWKSRPAPTLLRREIGPAPERLALGGEEHRSGQPPCSPINASACW